MATRSFYKTINSPENFSKHSTYCLDLHPYRKARVSLATQSAGFQEFGCSILNHPSLDGFGSVQCASAVCSKIS